MATRRSTSKSAETDERIEALEEGQAETHNLLKQLISQQQDDEAPPPKSRGRSRKTTTRKARQRRYQAPPWCVSATTKGKLLHLVIDPTKFGCWDDPVPNRSGELQMITRFREPWCEFEDSDIRMGVVAGVPADE